MIKLISAILIMSLAMLAGCATDQTRQAGAYQSGSSSFPFSANETPGPGKGPSGRF